MKQTAYKYVFALLLIFSPFFSSAYNNGDIGSCNATYSGGAVTWAAGNWAVYTAGSWVYNAAYVPASTDTVYILNGYTMTVTVTGDSCYNLIVESGGKLYSNDATLGNQYDLGIYGAFVLCNGTIGNPGTQDDIVFDMEGSNCTINGAGTFEAARIRKSSKTLPAKNTTNLTLSMNINLRYNSAIKDADLYNNVSGSAAFNVTFSAGYVDSLWSYGAAPGGDICIDGTQGTGSGERTGTFTVNGTLVIAGTLYLTTNNSTVGDSCGWVINNGGVIKTVSVNANASGIATHILRMNSGGKLQIAGTPFASSFSLSNNVYTLNSGSTIEYDAAGVQNIDNNLIYANLTISGSGTKTASGTLNINGNLTISTPAVLVPNTAINIGGNWTDYSTGGFTEAGSSVTFNGSGNQTVTVSNGESFANVTVNKVSGYVLLDSASKSKMTIVSPDSLTFISGIIIADTSNTGTNYVSISNGATVSGANNNSFVNGRVSRQGNTTFTFPVGKGSEYRPVSISNLSATIIMIAQYFHQDPDFGVPNTYATALVNAPIDSVSRCEYWTLVSSSNATAAVTLSWDTYSCGVTDPTTLLIAKDSVSASNWTSLGNGGTTGTVSQGTISSSSTISFYTGKIAAYTLADISYPNNPLPVSLLSFNAKAVQDNVLLNWITASEINNDYFTIERTADGSEFVSVGEVKGSGSSTSEINYTFIDKNPVQGVSYYRLKQTDYNGNYTYSRLAAIDFTTRKAGMITLFPNPTHDVAYINLSWETTPTSQVKDKTYTLHVFDVSGRDAMPPQQIIRFSSGMMQALDVTALPKGVYILQLNTDSDIQRTNLVKE